MTALPPTGRFCARGSSRSTPTREPAACQRSRCSRASISRKSRFFPASTSSSAVRRKARRVATVPPDSPARIRNRVVGDALPSRHGRAPAWARPARHPSPMEPGAREGSPVAQRRAPQGCVRRTPAPASAAATARWGSRVGRRTEARAASPCLSSVSRVHSGTIAKAGSVARRAPARCRSPMARPAEGSKTAPVSAARAACARRLSSAGARAARRRAAAVSSGVRQLMFACRRSPSARAALRNSAKPARPAPKGSASTRCSPVSEPQVSGEATRPQPALASEPREERRRTVSTERAADAAGRADDSSRITPPCFSASSRNEIVIGLRQHVR